LSLATYLFEGGIVDGERGRELHESGSECELEKSSEHCRECEIERGDFLRERDTLETRW